MLGAIALIRKLSFEYVAAADLTKPSIPDLAALITSWLDNPSDADTEEKNNDVRAIRRKAYGTIGDQLDLLYKDMLAGKGDSTGEWFKSIKAVKDANPKE